MGNEFLWWKTTMPRLLVVNALVEAGYQVWSAVDGPSGLEELTGPSEVDLVVTDVGLPGLNGRQMADATRALKLGQKFLFMTGYAESAIAAEGSLESGMALIAKPFTVDALLVQVRTLLS